METRHAHTISAIQDFLSRKGWVRGQCAVEFLAAGEYNENYLVRDGSDELVFRINHGTQLGLEDQISYEFEVLRAVYPSGVTPEPLRLCATDRHFRRGAMLMEYLPGVDFEYQRHARDAARLFAAVHTLPVTDRFIRQSRPVMDIAAESRGMLARPRSHPLSGTGDLISKYADHIEALGRTLDPLLAGERQCIVNTEVNSGNFIAPGPGKPGHLKLVDWEKAVVSSRCQDLAHFLVPTTTLWKTDFRFSPAGRREFLEEYHALAHPEEDIDELDRRTGLVERTIVLRALSWCYMAYAEYAETDRTLRNPETSERLTYYLDNAESFMGS